MDVSHEGKPLEIEQIDSPLRKARRFGTRKRKILHKRERYDRKFLIRASNVFSVVSLAVILGSVFLYFRTRDVSTSSSGGKGFSNSVMEGYADEANGLLSAEDAVEVVRSALENRNPTQTENFFILGASASTPQEAIELLVRIAKEDGLPHGYEPLGEKAALAGRAEEVMVTSSKDGQVSKRLAQLIPKNGKWRIDLDSYARHASPGWKEILSQKCDAGVVRVFVTPDSYYNGARYDEDLWKCYALISPDVDEMLFGYVARGSNQEKAMERIISKEEEVHRAALKILIPKIQGRMQFEISQVLADDWFIGESLFEESP